MADATTLPTTQRAYTLRLRGAPVPEEDILRELKCRTQNALAGNRPEPDEDQVRKEFQREEERKVRAALWSTHDAVNKGAKVFGDWLLTLRGGLDRRLADEKVKTKGKADRDPTPEERKNRRILLALSWLSVEDAHGAPRDESLIVAKGTDSTDTRERKLADALAAILQACGMADCDVGDPNKKPEDQPGTWLNDCLPSLAARIRDDADGAVWVNRSRAFDAASKRVGKTLTREIVWDMLEPFFGSTETYLAPVAADEISDGDSAAADEKTKDLVQKAGHWLSNRFGTGKGADFERMACVYDAMVNWAKGQREFSSGGEASTALANALAGFQPPSTEAAGVLKLISGPGYKSATRNIISNWGEREGAVTPEDVQKLAEAAAEDAGKCRNNVGGKGRRPYSDAILEEVEQACGFTYLQPAGPARHQEFAVMLDHAARRVSIAHSWIKRAEAQRRQFEADAQRITKAPEKALSWLRQYCKDRAGSSGSLEDYRIRKRAIDGWDKIVQTWAALGPNSTRQQRIDAARNVQANLDDKDKFGDIQLFAGYGDEDEAEPEACLADDAALCVWKPDGTPSAQPLKDFVAASEAETKKKRFKVPAYRHPDPLRHPVFTDFGNSRWDIDFSAHHARQKVLKCSGALAEAERELSSATEAQRQAEQKKVENCRKKLREAAEDLERNDDHRLELKVWNGQAVEPKPFQWSSKRLVDDLAIRSTGGSSSKCRTGVSRADRLGRAAVGAAGSGSVTLTGLFEQDHWNGRLQAPRAQLNAIARHVDKHGWNAKARELIDRIRWLVTFSAQLECRGPWYNYFHEQADKSPFRKVIASGPRKGQIYESANGWPHAISNDARAGHSRLILSRLPGLRVLSVDLGHRYAAACAVWAALAPEAMKTEIHDRMIVAGGSGPDELYCHTRHTNSCGKERTTVYRRIGPDMLPDGSAHPAPWARLDRQFLIKLQGEDRPARMASTAEIQAVEQLEECVGRKRFPDDPPRELAVDALMSDTVRTVRLALKRHGDRARIAFAMTADYKPMPGERRYYFNKPEDASTNDDEHKRRDRYIEFLQDALALWHGLFSSRGWKDDAANALWDQNIVALHGYQAPEEIAEDVSPAERKKRRQANKDKLRPAAEALAENVQLRQQLHEEWKNRWTSDDGAPAEVNRDTGRKLQDGTGWHGRMRHLQDWLMPRQLSRMIEVTKQDGRQVKRRKPIREAIAAASNVGGLSLTRISTFTEFRRKVQVGYFTRMWPDGRRAEIGLGFGQSTLDTLERMKDQRIKQLASRIVEAALGIGIDQEPVWDDVKEKWREHKRPHQRSTDPRFAPCHAVIIEDLSHYRPEETRTRRENRATMDWKSAETRKRLEDHCQLYGLHLRDVNPQYTSRQDSRTGAPGVRCVDVPVVDFLTKPWWRKQVARARSKTDQNNKGDARDRYLLALHTRWSAASEEEKARAAPLRITLDGGDIFVSADPRSPLAGGIQADLNAAANIGLRALMDPDFPGRWWYVPCDPATLQPKADKVKGCMLETIGSLAAVKQADQTTPPKPKRKRSAKATKEKEVVNLWRDPAPDLLNPKSWCEYTEYLSRVRFRVIQILRARAGLPRDDGK